ncbi:ParB/RepB/Spo0J family partition protein [Actinokineospora sp. PR83]|uniref:ParB/RepB/Spo0J family partition protein n=1 Tax=Actinokineospora sp. PR83 TaxID=2884908 RepID=UPI001F25FEAC|nr:ParB/RepB/Spo0J family partition protein [Actinokineospora sp. PR83]MCG8919417.1 ParB/RepB/Spo0J family partition protein [Actinokineospora sp. PR83]
MGRRRHVEGSALTGSASTPATVPVTSIAHNPRNPRDDYDDVQELANSIGLVGVLQPLGVVRYETFLSHFPEHEHEVGTHDWVVMQGNRRLAAARKAGLDEVPVHVVDRLGREDQLDESVLIENIHRQDLPPLREAHALQLLKDRHGTQSAVARRIGKTDAFVSQRLSLLKLTAELQQEVRAGRLRIEDARSISRLKPEQQAEAWRDLQAAAAAPTAGLNGVKTEPDAADDTVATAAGLNAVKTGAPTGHASRKSTRPDTVLSGSVEEAAEQLRGLFGREELAALIALLSRDA